MKKLLVGLLIVGGVIAATLLVAKPGANPSSNITNNNSVPNNTLTAISVVADNLDTPWAIAFLLSRQMLVTERGGFVNVISEDGKITNKIKIENAREIGEGGLLGIASHPNFANNNFIYLYYTYRATGAETLNRVVRMVFEDNQLTSEEIIVDAIPGSANHNGGRIKFGPDGYLYITTGDAGNSSYAQDTNSLAGKILRVTDNGMAVSDNPFNNLVYSYGHRNSQGLDWDSNGNLWTTEHGRSNPTGFDEVNLIEKGKNYGWPTIEGDKIQSGMETPKINSGANTTWAPAGISVNGNFIYFGGLRGQALYKVSLQNKNVSNLEELFKNVYGRIREVIKGPDNMIYITTSNKDGRGNPKSGDDKILRFDPSKL